MLAVCVFISIWDESGESSGQEEIGTRRGRDRVCQARADFVHTTIMRSLSLHARKTVIEREKKTDY